MNRIKGSAIWISLVLFLMIVLTPSCEDNFNSSIPYVRVWYSINLTNMNDLTVDGNSVIIPAGYAGVIVTNSGIGYYACDAACPYEVDIKCRVIPEGAIGTCPCCGSQYLLLDGGSVIAGTGPSTEPLRPYSVATSPGQLIITN